jgi:adenine phosphoribosyltransferase
VDGENHQKASVALAPNTDVARTFRHRIHTYQHFDTQKQDTMVTLDTLKRTLRKKAAETAPSPPSSTQGLSDSQYKAGFDILMQDHGRTTYPDFIVPQLSLLLAPLFHLRPGISILEVGPGPKSVLGYLPWDLRCKIRKYAAFEPNNLFASELQGWLCSSPETESPLPCLEELPDIKRAPFVPNSNAKTSGSVGAKGDAEGFDVILFCHSLYGMKPKHEFIQCALNLLIQSPADGLVVVFHRGEILDCNGLACYRMATFPTGVVRVADNDEVLDSFSHFIAGHVMKDPELDKAVSLEWRKACRSLGRREEAHPDQLLFDSPDMMVVFNRQATSLPDLMSKVPLMRGDKNIKNWEARSRHPASIMRPKDTRQVQQCVQWALDHGLNLTVLGGGHSGHCLWSNVISVDMGAFDQVHVLPATSNEERSALDPGPMVVAGAGCKSGDIIRKTMEAGLTVPLGARPSVGAGLWLQGGIGHLARLHGLTCDAIVGAVVVSIASSQVLCIGVVPGQHQPPGAVHPENESDLMWAMRGAGTNFGIVVSITFKAYAAPTYSVHNWVVPLNHKLEARRKLSDFDALIARKLPRNWSADAYLYWNESELHLGVTMFESHATGLTSGEPKPGPTPIPTPVGAILGSERSVKTVDGVGLFETEMFMSGMHGGHGDGKTSSFKRCVFLKCIGVDVADMLVAAIESRPSPLCYVHLLQCGGAVGDVASGATAFGCRDWNFACVVTGVWPRKHDETEITQAAVQWVYGADLGPDPRDAMLADKAFGPNRSRLARLKRTLDPGNVLAYACPLTTNPILPKVIILVTGESCAGKDHCADVWCSLFISVSHKSLRAQTLSISDTIKRGYAAATGADLERLLWDRAYKEQHRPTLTKYFENMVRRRPQLLEEQFLQVVENGAGMDVLLITGMRDEAPIASYSHLVPESRLLEIHVEASKDTRQVRRGRQDEGGEDGKESKCSKDCDERPSFVFNNDMAGCEAAERAFEHHLFPFFHEDLQRLANMVPLVPSFPRPGVQFHHVLEISQQPGGLALCTSLLQNHFTGDWTRVNALVCCETGGFVFASPLAARVDIPLALIREAGKLPPPTISVIKSPSHVSSSASHMSRKQKIEIGRDVIPRNSSVVVVDDVLATGKTLCAVLQLLDEAGIGAKDVDVMVVAEFPFHRGRQLLRQRGFGGARIQSLLVFGGV